MNKISVIFITILLFIGTLTSNAAAHSGALAFDYIFYPPMYRGESAFTKIPASIGSLVTTLPAFTIGGTAYVIGSIVGAPFNKEQEIAAIAAIYSGIGTVWLGSTVAGAPFYVAEKTLYDLPVAIFSHFINDKENDSPKKDLLKKQTRSVIPREIPNKPPAIAKGDIIEIEAVESPKKRL